MYKKIEFTFFNKSYTPFGRRFNNSPEARPSPVFAYFLGKLAAVARLATFSNRTIAPVWLSVLVFVQSSISTGFNAVNENDLPNFAGWKMAVVWSIQKSTNFLRESVGHAY